MSPVKKQLASFITICFFFLIAIASAPAVKNLTVEKGKIPPGFRGYKNTLLIEGHSKDYNHYAEKYFSENYKGKYKIIGSILGTDYVDMDQYRFIITRRTTSETTRNWSAKPGENTYQTQNATSYYILDRQMNKEYTIATSPAYGKVLKALSKALEVERNK